MAVFTIPKPEPTLVPSSNRHLPVSKTTSFSPGTLIPILCKDILPGDKVKINIDSLIESFPMVAPNLNGYKASFDFYFCPWSNYYGWMDNNKRTDNVYNTVLNDRYTVSVGAMRPDGSFVREEYEVLSRVDDVLQLLKCSIKPGSLLDYLGIPPGFVGVQSANTVNGAPAQLSPVYAPLTIPAEKLISVLDIYRSYYVNTQEDYASFIGINDGDGVRPLSSLYRIPLKALDRMTMALRANEDYTLSVDEVLDSVPADGDLSDFDTLGEFVRHLLGASCASPLGGLPLRTYRMDLNRGLLKQTESQFVSKVRVADGEFSVDTLRFASKMQMLLDRIDVSGGRFSDMMRMRWGVTPRNTLNVPDYLGSVSNFFGVTDVISTASGTNDNVPDNRGNSVLGQQAGFAVGKVKRDNAPISFRADQYGTLVCMFSLVPLVTYSQGIELEDLKTSFAEVFDPAFNQLGYQDVMALELNALPSLQLVPVQDTVDEQSTVLSGIGSALDSVGRRFAFSEYMSSLPRAHGLFAYGQSLDYWVNNRHYLRDMDVDVTEGVEDYINPLLPYGSVSFSTYIDPAVQNNLFAEVGRFAQNFRLRVNFDMYMRRNVGSRVMPHL